MRKVLFVALSLLASVGLVALGSSAESEGLKGDYVEARTASVFAGACHYNGELTTTGRDAVMAWSFTSGGWRGVNLAGVRVLAVVGADENLASEGAPHRAEIVIDSEASDAQSAAVLDLLKSKYAASLGNILTVRRLPVGFRREGESFTVSASGVASLNVNAMPNHECCRMPHLVWYAPLVPLGDRKVGYTKKALYAGGAAGEAWQRSGENSAFYGSFSL